jgi:hypothetical protein
MFNPKLGSHELILKLYYYMLLIDSFIGKFFTHSIFLSKSKLIIYPVFVTFYFSLNTCNFPNFSITHFLSELFT